MSRQSLDSNNSLKGNELKNLHYEFTGETKEVFGVTLHRIRATRDLPNFGVRTGAVGGWIEHTGNLAGNAWVADEAKVFGNAKVYENALVSDNARVFGDAEVHGSARVYGDSQVYRYALVYGNARVYGNAEVCDTAKVYGNAQVFGYTCVCSYAQVFGNAKVYGEAQVFGNAWVCGYARVLGRAKVFGDVKVYGDVSVCADAHIEKDYDYLHVVTCTSKQFSLTLTRQKDGKHLIRMGCWLGTIDEFDVLIAKPRWLETYYVGADEARPEMEALASMMRARIERWK